MSLLMASPLLDLKVGRLNDFGSDRVVVNQDTQMVLVVFQPDCAACFDQIQDLKCLSVDIKLLGAFGSKQDLRQEYRKFGVSYSAYSPDEKALARLGVTLKLTPQVIAFSKGRRFHSKGKVPCKDIRKFLEG